MQCVRRNRLHQCQQAFRLGVESGRPAAAADEVESLKMYAIPVGQHLQYERRRRYLLRWQTIGSDDRANDIILQGFVKESIGRIAAGDRILQSEIS